MLSAVIFSSCGDTKADYQSELVGTWLVLYPDHQLRTKSERDVYTKYQDSLVNLYGLKLISLTEDGKFTELDSLFKRTGKWTVANENELALREGGKGFDPLATTIQNLENDTLQLVHHLSLDNEKIKVVWHLKNVEKDTIAQKLVSPQMNLWRKKPARLESDAEIRDRLVGLLSFYSEYLKLVSEESSYFLKARVPLPFNYYQHAIGMREQISPAFVSLFYDEKDAQKGYEILSQTIARFANEFEWGDNFVVEYAAFFRKMTYFII